MLTWNVHLIRCYKNRLPTSESNRYIFYKILIIDCTVPRFFQMSPTFWRVGAPGPQNRNSWLEHCISHFMHAQLPDKLKALKSIPMDSLIETLHELRPVVPNRPSRIPNWAYEFLAFIVALVLGLSIFLYCKCKQRLGSLCHVRRLERGGADTPDVDEGYKLVSTKSTVDGTTRAVMITPTTPAGKTNVVEMQEVKKLYPTFLLVPEYT